MAATFTLEFLAKLSGLNSDDSIISGLATLGQTPTATSGVQFRTIATTNTEETLDVGDVATVDMIILKAVSGDIAVDTSFNATFSTEIIAEAGELPLIFKPNGTVKVKNNTADETPTYSYMVIGRT